MGLKFFFTKKILVQKVFCWSKKILSKKNILGWFEKFFWVNIFFGLFKRKILVEKSYRAKQLSELKFFWIKQFFGSKNELMNGVEWENGKPEINYV